MSETIVDAEISDSGTQPTQYEKIRAIPWSLGYDLANTFFVQLTFFGSVFILFLNDLGLRESQIGLLLAILPFLSLLSLFITPPVAKAGYRRTFLTFMGLRTLFSAGLLLVPWLVSRFDSSFILRYVTFITIVFAIGRAIAMTALLPWQQEYIPHHMRGRYAGYSSIIISLAGLAAVGIAGFVLDRPLGEWKYSILFGLGVFFGIISLFLASRIPGGQPAKSKFSLFQIDKRVFGTLRDSRFFRYLVALGLVTLTIGPIFSFLPIFMREKVGLDPGRVVFLQTGAMLGSLLSSYFWGWLADRYGSKPISLTGLLMTATLPVLWYLMPRDSAFSFSAALGISFLQGIAGSGWGIGSGRLLFVSIVSGENRAEYLSQYNAWIGVLGGAGSILGGFLLQYFSSLQTTIFNLRFDSYSMLFSIGFIMSLAAALLLYSIPTLRESGLGEFAGLFLHGNPLTAISSVIRFYFARKESDVVTATERLGMTRSPLTVEELINSLNDPRFYVRFEALVSISRHSANDRLIEAVIDVMESPDPALSVIAAWALGRMGSATALPALRHAFRNSKYRSVRAHAARALGTLADEESIPVLMEQLQTNPDLGIQVACASSLGKLKVKETTAELLNILYIDSYPQSRREMGLSLARLLDAEGKYIELSRRLDEDPGTALAQEMEGLRNLLKKEFAGQEDLLPNLIEAREQFARGKLDEGIGAFINAIQLLPLEEVPVHYRQIILDCIIHMRELGQKRMEYATLAVITVGKFAK